MNITTYSGDFLTPHQMLFKVPKHSRRWLSEMLTGLFGSLFHDRIQGDSAASHADALLYEVALYHRLSDMKKGWNAH